MSSVFPHVVRPQRDNQQGDDGDRRDEQCTAGSQHQPSGTCQPFHLPFSLRAKFAASRC
jgi:hypothetical protein